MVRPGFRFDAGLIPGERIGRTISTSNSSGFTTIETTLMSLTVPVLDGHRYEIEVHAALDTSVAGDAVDIRVREDSDTGTEMILRRVELPDTSGRWPGILSVDYDSDADEDKTFVFTGDRASGTGTIILIASATIPSKMTAKYVEPI